MGGGRGVRPKHHGTLSPTPDRPLCPYLPGARDTFKSGRRRTESSTVHRRRPTHRDTTPSRLPLSKGTVGDPGSVLGRGEGRRGVGVEEVWGSTQRSGGPGPHLLRGWRRYHGGGEETPDSESVYRDFTYDDPSRNLTLSTRLRPRHVSPSPTPTPRPFLLRTREGLVDSSCPY